MDVGAVFKGFGYGKGKQKGWQPKGWHDKGKSKGWHVKGWHKKGKDKRKGWHEGKGSFDKDKGKHFQGAFGKDKGGKSSGSYEGAFPGYCGGRWKWGHKKSQCPERSSKMDISALSSASSTVPSSSNSSVLGPTSVSQKSTAICGLTKQEGVEQMWDSDDDWPIYYDDGWMCDAWAESPYWSEVGASNYLYDDPNWQSGETWLNSWEEDNEAGTEGQDGEGIWICGLTSKDDAGSSSKHVTTPMLDSGSQATACAPELAPEYGVDDTTRAQMWDIQGNPIGSYGKKVVDLKFVSDSGDVDAPSCSGHRRCQEECGWNGKAVQSRLRHALYKLWPHLLDGTTRPDDIDSRR